MLRLAGALIASLVAVMAAALVLLRRYEVEGRSMLPAHAPGDRVVALPLRLSRPLRRGDVVVVERPGGRCDLKRVAAGPGDTATLLGEERRLAADEWYLLGDNAAESTDSRQLGTVRTRQIVGRVVWRY